jgi:hypothetical protein
MTLFFLNQVFLLVSFSSLFILMSDLPFSASPLLPICAFLHPLQIFFASSSLCPFLAYSIPITFLDFILVSLTPPLCMLVCDSEPCSSLCQFMRFIHLSACSSAKPLAVVLLSLTGGSEGSVDFQTTKPWTSLPDSWHNSRVGTP